MGLEVLRGKERNEYWRNLGQGIEKPACLLEHVPECPSQWEGWQEFGRRENLYIREIINKKG